MQVELIFDTDCPNVDEARAQLRRAFEAVHVVARWQEWTRGAVGNPSHVQQCGSPTILIDGQDVAASGVAEGSTCRLYTDNDGKLRRVPPLERIMRALAAATRRSP
jgi:mercuric ion transport protein